MKLRTILLTAFGAAIVLCAVSCKKDQKGFSGTSVDLGVSAKWASTNAGANQQGEIGTEMTLEEALAYVAESKKWRLPAISDWQNLMSQCTSAEYSKLVDGTFGWLISGKEGAQIYIPAGKYLGEQEGDAIKFYDLTKDPAKIGSTTKLTEKFFIRLVK